MPTAHSALQHSRGTRRRFSASAGNRPPGSPKTAPVFLRHGHRRVSLSPPNTADPRNHLRRNHFTDASDYEEEHMNGSGFRHRSRSMSPKPLFLNKERPTAYSSLPPTPIMPPEPYTPPTPLSPLSPTFGSHEPHKIDAHEAPFSLWDYLREELLATDFDSHQEQKWERVSNFLSMPVAMEKVCSLISVVKKIS